MCIPLLAFFIRLREKDMDTQIIGIVIGLASIVATIICATLVVRTLINKNRINKNISKNNVTIKGNAQNVSIGNQTIIKDEDKTNENN